MQVLSEQISEQSVGWVLSYVGSSPLNQTDNKLRFQPFFQSFKAQHTEKNARLIQKAFRQRKPNTVYNVYRRIQYVKHVNLNVICNLLITSLWRESQQWNLNHMSASALLVILFPFMIATYFMWFSFPKLHKVTLYQLVMLRRALQIGNVLFFVLLFVFRVVEWLNSTDSSVFSVVMSYFARDLSYLNIIQTIIVTLCPFILHTHKTIVHECFGECNPVLMANLIQSEKNINRKLGRA